MEEKVKRQISIIAGPCSAESEMQLREVAFHLKDRAISFMRAGVWKPRTKPGHFEGIGEVALNWLKQVESEFGIHCITEVASAKHVEKVLEAGLQAVWIGARTSVNPFYVQDIADALSGQKVTVFVKNPINPDVNLWLGAIERIENANVKAVAAIHRGFSMYGQSKFRNEPYWQIPIDVMTQRPEIPMYCDISHISGTRELLQEIAQKALDLNYAGLMIETHPNPIKALSDKEQQVTPAQLFALLDRLVIRQTAEEEEIVADLQYLRRELDQIDEELIDLIGTRMRLSEKIGRIKKRNNISILSPTRWRHIIAKAVQQSNRLGLTESFIRNVFKHIHDESIEKQISVMQAAEEVNVKS